MKQIILLAAVAFISHTSVSQNCPEKVLRAGEELQYKVKWNFLRVGTIILRTEHDTTTGDTGHYRLIMTVESNPMLAFLRIHEYNESCVLATDPHSLHYLGKHASGDDSTLITYSYDPMTRRARCLEKDLRTGETRFSTTLEDAPPFVEGASLLLYARTRCHTGKAYGVPTMVGNGLHKTHLDFSGEKEKVNVDALRSPIFAIRYTGSADWKGGTSAGLTGEFCGWVSDDDAAVPLRAEMKVFLGSITIELEKWVRPGWAPPSDLQSSN